MNELALFAGAGGGILGGKLLGWRTVCAVEWDQYAATVLAQRQNDGFLEAFPIWDDVQTFDGRPWQGVVDVISGGFPCQDISAARTTMTKTEIKKGWTGKKAECGNKWRELSAKYDRNSSSWKTHRTLYETDLPESSVILPRWGMMRDGVLSELTTAALRTSESGSGLCPTPTAHNAKEQDSPAEATRKTPTLTHKVRGGDKTQPRHLNPEWVEWLMGWPRLWTKISN